jgi:hypothetical protein
MTQMIDKSVLPGLWSAVLCDLHHHVRCAVAQDIGNKVQHVVGTPVRTVTTQVWYPTEDELRDSHDAQY